MISTLIVDDESIACRRLRKLLDGFDDIEVVGEATDGVEAAKYIVSLRPQVVLLDIHMPGSDGFEVVESLPEDVNPVIIFVTAYDEFAVRAFEKHAVDYLLKPVERDRLRTALERARLRLATDTAGPPYRTDEVLRDAAQPDAPRRLLVRVDGRLVVIDTDDIEWIEAAGNYAIIHTAREKLITRRTMAALEARLAASNFARVHRSVIVNIGRISQIEPHYNNDYRVTLDSGAKVPMSRTFRDTVTGRMDEL